LVQLRTRRTALLLYSVLLILPTIVLGGLQGYQIRLDYREELAAVPENARDAVERLVDGIAQRLSQLLEAEEQRPFYHYAKVFSPASAVGEQLSLQVSPLDRELLPPGVLAWFSYNLSDGYDARVSLLTGYGGEQVAEEPREPPRELEAAARELMLRNLEEGFLRRAARLGSVHTVELPIATAAVFRGYEQHGACLTGCFDLMRGWSLPISYSRFHLRFYRAADGTPRVLATRRVLTAGPQLELPDDAHCLRSLIHGFGLVQGFFVDPEWLFERLPVETADHVLKGSVQTLHVRTPPHDEHDETYHHEPVALVRELGIEHESPADGAYGGLEVRIDKRAIEERYREQSLGFFGVAAMLGLTLGTGMVLLLRSVKSDLLQAEQTENFVAAVTHELRTPLSAIRLHGEMLLEGWVEEPEKQREYYRRIVQETSRLSTLVERVLEQARLSSGSARPVSGDLNAVVEGLRPTLEDRADGESSDLVFRLQPHLPPALLTPEAVAGILANLVENARKYAPPATHGPIEVSTHAGDDEVLLEVADRGPGVPFTERERVFQAFYRVGNESTRTSIGTGLGLHLVHLHAESVGARASVHARPGGGALFRIAFGRAS